MTYIVIEAWKEEANVGRVWRIGRVDAFRRKGHGFDSRFSMKLRHSIRAVSVAHLSSSGLEEAL